MNEKIDQTIENVNKQLDKTIAAMQEMNRIAARGVNQASEQADRAMSVFRGEESW